ncbi:aminotransferase class V-fold PLP-dependent enzyme [Metallosphaera sedula]|uniref:aminotransferase class V-fold PLP-dependent enzyme n=1 Tax=Metallosphaera sedula TaxID=43687 RepID=UPI0020BF3345|nr:aminotransferase class V-fold PLP-dependent enzyme [Metallosphaera sedula]BBL46750.1 cysteine desulfurase [Metallosphaera sedula]
MKEFREQIPVTRDYIYLNHAAISPTPIFALMESFGYLYGVSSRGSLHVNSVEKDDFYSMRKTISNFINSYPEEVSFIPNTSYGINMIVHGLSLTKGDQVLTDNLEFPATVYPLYKLAKRGVEIRMVKSSPERLEDAILEQITDSVRLIVLSHVSFNTGVRLDVKRIADKAKKNGSLLLVDAIQSAGAMKIDVKEIGVDFLVAGGYKWMMSPQGSGFMYVRKGLIPDPPFYGWKTSSTFMEFNAESFSLEEGPRRFEIGTMDVSANLAMTKVAERLTPIRDEVERRVLDLSARVIDLAEDKGLEVVTPREKRAGIVIVKTKDPKKVAEELLAKRIVVSPRGSGVRISTHFYNEEEEVDRAVTEIKNLQA